MSQLITSLRSSWLEGVPPYPRPQSKAVVVVLRVPSPLKPCGGDGYGVPHRIVTRNLMEEIRKMKESAARRTRKSVFHVGERRVWVCGARFYRVQLDQGEKVQNQYILYAKIGLDRAENEPLSVWGSLTFRIWNSNLYNALSNWAFVTTIDIDTAESGP